MTIGRRDIRYFGKCTVAVLVIGLALLAAGMGVCQISPATAPQATSAPAPPATGPSQPMLAAAPIREKETKETKEIRDRPSDLVEIVNALAWPVSFILLMLIFLTSLVISDTLKSFFGIAISVVRKFEIGVVKIEVDASVVDKVKKFLGDSLGKLVDKAKVEYEKMASAALVEDRLSDVVRKGLRAVLKQHGLDESPMGLRATVHVPDIVFKDYMYQLVEYYPGSEAGRKAGRRFSQRYGIIGRAWRTGRSTGRGTAVTGSDAAHQLILYWGMQPREADDRSHVRPANLCVVLVDDKLDDRPVGLLYIDSFVTNAFGIDPPDSLFAAPSDVDLLAPSAEDVAMAVANDPSAKALAHAVAQVMDVLRSAGPAIDVTDLRYENDRI